MKGWTEEIIIHTPIEHLFSYFDGSLDQMQKLMPQVIENTPIKETDAIIENIYRQKYKEGNDTQEYAVEILNYINTPTYKNSKFGFSLSNMFAITATYELRQISELQTLFKYTATNQVVVGFVNRIKTIAESEYIK